MTKPIRVSEIFGPTVQGEGPLIGRPTIFVRTGGCDFRCAWCDTLYAVLPKHRGEWMPMTADEILARVEALAGGTPALISLSGGNPAMQPLARLLELGRAKGHSFALETQGSLAQPWFAELDWLILSPKPPSAGVGESDVSACLEAARGGPCVALKIVIFDEADYAFARMMATRHPVLPLYLQVGNPHLERADTEDLMRRFRWLVGRVAGDRWFEATVLPQLHVLAWGNERGV